MQENKIINNKITRPDLTSLQLPDTYVMCKGFSRPVTMVICEDGNWCLVDLLNDKR